MRAVSLHQQGGGFPGAQGKDIPQPGAPGKTVIGGSLDHGQGEERGDPSRGHVPQYRPVYLGRPPPKAPQGLPINSAKYGGLWRQATGIGAGGNHRRSGGNSVATTVGVREFRRGGLHQPATLAAAVWDGDSRTVSYCMGVQRLYGQG